MNLNVQLNKISATIQDKAPAVNFIVFIYLFVLWIFSIVDAIKQIDIMNSLPEDNIVLVFSAAMYTVLISFSVIFSILLVLSYQNRSPETHPLYIVLAAWVYCGAILLLISITLAIGYMIGESYQIASDIAAITYNHNLKLYEPALIAQLILLIIYPASLVPTKQKSQ